MRYVCGYFKDVHCKLDLDPKGPADSYVEVIIGARKIWAG
jgi:hypothetical protein